MSYLPQKSTKSTARQKADEIKAFRCKNLIAVLENPRDLKNIGTVIRNVNALGVEKAYIVDSKGLLADDWQEMQEQKSLSKTSVSAIKWSFVKKFESTAQCFAHLEAKGFTSVVTSPHTKGQHNVSLDAGDFTQKKLAVWFGSENTGISELALEKSSYCVNIPMYGMIESLNLGTSTGIVLYEITKQRRAYQNRKKL
jgi:tRNA (guanosine-2'-O-)-methyltransferase